VKIVVDCSPSKARGPVFYLTIWLERVRCTSTLNIRQVFERYETLNNISQQCFRRGKSRRSKRSYAVTPKTAAFDESVTRAVISPLVCALPVAAKTESSITLASDRRLKPFSFMYFLP
jgi:hypothetical protein